MMNSFLMAQIKDAVLADVAEVKRRYRMKALAMVR